jgi:hypothetical protein
MGAVQKENMGGAATKYGQSQVITWFVGDTPAVDQEMFSRGINPLKTSGYYINHLL